jgi:arabinan endo-1,5-alpha-L-arabinosidase
VSGAVTGTWLHRSNNLIDVTLATGGLFNGVLSRQWNPNANTFVVTFSAQSADGVSIWGARTGD